MRKFIGTLVIIAAICFLFKLLTNVPAYEPPEKVSTTLGYRCPARGQSLTEEQIMWMQAALNRCIEAEGLEAEPLEVDGSFGPASRAATAAFQQATGLEAEGELNAATIETMINVLDDGLVGFGKDEAPKVTWTLEAGDDSMRLMKNPGPDGAELTVDYNTSQTSNSRSTTITVTDEQGKSRSLTLTTDTNP